MITVPLTFTEGNVPAEIEPGSMAYFFVAMRSSYDGQIRIFGAFYLNGYPLVFEDRPCPDCPDPDGGGPTCHGAETGQCPVTGWVDERWNGDDQGYFEFVAGDVVAYAKKPDWPGAADV